MFKNKYLKYKHKYLELKNQIGGSQSFINKFDTQKFKSEYKNICDTYEPNSLVDIKNQHNIIGFFRRYFNTGLLAELKKLQMEELERITEKLNTYGHLPSTLYLLRDSNLIWKVSTLLGSQKKDIYDVINLLFKININDFETITCSVDQFMNNDFDAKTKCHNRPLVRGSCGDPDFFNNLNNENSGNEQIIELLNIIKTKLEKGKSIAIILGATTIFDSSCDINLYFNICTTQRCTEYKLFREILKDINENPLKDVYKIASYFPLNTESSNRNVLDIILELTNDYKITLINQMCGSCFRSFYYLKKHAKKNFIYILKPEQGIIKNENDIMSQDTPAIMNCFVGIYNNN